MFNRNRLLELMRSAELDALVVTLPENVTYLTGYSNPLIKYFPDLEEYAVVTRSGRDVMLVIPGVNAGFAVGRDLSATDITLYGKFVVLESPPFTTEEERAYAHMISRSGQFTAAQDAVEGVLRDAGVANGRIGIDKLGYHVAQHAQLAGRLPEATFINAGEMVRSARAVKTAQEVGRLREAAKVNEAAYAALREAIRPGVKLAEPMKHYRMAIAELGGEYAFSSTTSGVMGGGPWLDPQLMTLEEGDVIRFDGVMRYNDYWSDFGRTLVVETIRPDVQRVYDALREGYDAALALIQDGARIGEIFTTGLAITRQAGLPEFDRHHVGHGIGLHPYDHPVISPTPGSMYASNTGDAYLEEGMVMCVEFPLYHLGVGGWQIEDTLLVTADGFEFLTTTDREINVC